MNTETLTAKVNKVRGKDLQMHQLLILECLEQTGKARFSDFYNELLRYGAYQKSWDDLKEDLECADVVFEVVSKGEWSEQIILKTTYYTICPYCEDRVDYGYKPDVKRRKNSAHTCEKCGGPITKVWCNNHR